MRTHTKLLRNDCWRSAGYYTCDQFVDGISKAFIVFTYDPVHREYRSYPIPTDGGAAGSGRLLISGDTWTFSWQEPVNGKSTSFRVVNVFVGRDAIAYRQESSTDGVHWIASATGFERRVRSGGERRS